MFEFRGTVNLHLHGTVNASVHLPSSILPVMKSLPPGLKDITTMYVKKKTYYKC